jgi:hypothetical protein
MAGSKPLSEKSSSRAAVSPVGESKMKAICLCVGVFLCNTVLWGGQSNSRTNLPADPASFNGGKPVVGSTAEFERLQLELQALSAAPRSSAMLNVAQIRRDADEFSRLAQSISIEISRSQRGILCKDLDANLKKIRKVSKRLREELNL